MEVVVQKNRRSGLCVFGSLYPYTTGGMEIFNYYFLRHLLKEDTGRYYYVSDHPLEGEPDTYIRLKNIWPIRLFYPLQFFFIILRMRKKIDFASLSYAEQSWIISFSQSFILGLFGIPYVITVHWGQEPAWRFSAPFIYYFNNAHSIIGVSELICDRYKKNFPNKEILYIPPLIPFEESSKSQNACKEQLGFSNSEKMILYVGALKAMKNPDKILAALLKLGSPFLAENKIRLVFAGTGEMESSLKAFTQEHGLGEFVRFVGLVRRENIPYYFKAADSYIISSDYEGTSISLLEAMFNKLPIIASDAPGINRMVTHQLNALLYETNNPLQLAQAIKWIHSDPTLAEKLARQAQADYLAKYSFRTMLDKYQYVFNSIIEH